MKFSPNAMLVTLSLALMKPFVNLYQRESISAGKDIDLKKKKNGGSLINLKIFFVDVLLDTTANTANT